MRKVLLINEGGLGNLGDEAIRVSLEQLLKDADCEVSWASFSGFKSTKVAPAAQAKPTTPFLLKKLVRLVLPLKLRWLLRNWTGFLSYLRANQYDLVLIGGGQLIQSNGTFAVAMFIWVHLLKRFHKKSVILIGVGATDTYTRLDKYLYRKSLKSVDAIYVRDRDSLSVLKNIFGVSSKLIPDIAFYISEIYKYRPRKEKRVLFCPVSYEFYKRKRTSPDARLDENSYFRYWEEQVLKYCDEDYQVRLFYTSKNSDLSAVEKIRQRLRDKHAIDLEVSDACTLQELTQEIAGSEVVVAARMHALIIGYCYGCRVIPFETSEKLKSFEEEYVDSGVTLNEIQSRIVDTVKEAIGIRPRSHG
jgi:polysaccharide pyruvyl transferase WcaK-like protein